MQNFLNVLRKYRFQYMIVASLAATIVLVNNVVDFSEKIMDNSLLLFISLAIFYFFITISIKEEIWKNGK